MRRHSRSRLRTEGRGIRITFKSNLGWGKLDCHLPICVLVVSSFFLCIIGSVLFLSFETYGRIFTQVPNTCDISWFYIGHSLG
jgi:hypothetical protein